MSLLLTGGTIVRSIRPIVIEAADLLIEDGRVTDGRVAAGRAGADGTTPHDARRLDCSRCLIVPGNVCAHTHLYSTLARGMPYRLAAPRTFTEILRRVWWRLDRALDAEAIRASAFAGGMEALLAGTTTVIDHHASPSAVSGSLDIVADALAELGIRSVLCYETSDRDGPVAASQGLAENERFLAATSAAERSLARGMVGAHASFTLSRETLAACVCLARERRVGLHVHVAEDAADERDADGRFGMRVAARLDAAGALDARALLAHGVHLDPSEVELVRETGATVVHNARSNMNNGVGRAPLGALGERVALGTDGIGADMFEEGRAAWLRRREEDAATSMTWPLDRLAEGARVAGEAFAEPLLGSLEPGAPGDAVVLDYPAVTPVDAGTLAAHWLFGIGSGSVRDVIVAGELVVRERRLVRADSEDVAAAARAAAGDLWRRLEEIDVHPFEPEGTP
jgi:putative selenium metabolism protein SsnA